jgi:SAM-dependent methyltransferase
MANPTGSKTRRTLWQRVVDGATFPLRAVCLFHKDRWGLSSLATERFDYVAREVSGYCLDVGCGLHDRFVREYLGGNGHGIDIFAYEGLTAENIVEDLTQLPFPDRSFGAVTFIANLNHCPKPQRDAELMESWRVLKPGGKIILTMGNPLAEIMVHGLVWAYDKFLGTKCDMDGERGMDAEETYYVTDAEIRDRLHRAGFVDLRKKYFLTQWGLNHLFVGTKHV